MAESRQDERERALVRAGWNDPHAMKTVDRMIAEVDAEHPRDPWRAFADFFDAKAKWSRETFGPGDRLRGVLAHIRKELSEIEREPSDIEEWIDVVMLAMDGAWRVAGADGEAFVSALLAKHEKNIGRIWPDWRTASNDAPIEHDRALDRMHPRPATDAAAVRAECARVLRKASQVADDNGLRGLSGSLSRDADRIEAAHPQAEPVTDWRESYRRASAALDAARDAAAEPITGPYAHLYTREEALKLMRYSSYETTKAGTSVLDFPALLDATVKR